MAGKEKVKFWKAGSEIVELANSLIAKYNHNASGANICYLFKSKHGKQSGLVVAGTCKKESDKSKILHGYDYVITLADDIWQEMAPKQREALLMHEILHISAEEDEQTGDIEFGINGHDTEEFRKVIEEYGFWNDNLERLAEVVEARTEEKPEKKVVKKVEEVRFDEKDDGIFKKK